MPLSEEERRRLQELEEQLIAADPDLARKLGKGGPSGRSGAQKVYGLLIIVAGFALLLTGISTGVLVLGIMGFLLAGTGAYLFSNSLGTHRSP
jgi:hypothetical protein